MMERVQKQKIFYRGYFLGLGLHKSMLAMEVAMECHTGHRRGGGPEISHQFEIVGMLLQAFESRLDPVILDVLIATAFLHDVVEDYSHIYDQEAIIKKFGPEVSAVVALVTKSSNFKKNHEHRTQYYDGMLENVLAVILKCFDRIHNLQSMIAGFKPEKQHEYIDETETYFYPMIKQARINSPDMYIVFVAIQQQMEMIIRLSKEVLKKHEAMASRIAQSAKEDSVRRAQSAEQSKAEPVEPPDSVELVKDRQAECSVNSN